MRRRSVALLAVVVAAGAMLLAWSQPWFEVEIAAATGAAGGIVIGGDRAGAPVLAIALAILAVTAVLALAGRVLRVVLGVVIALLGLGSAVSSVLVLVDPSAVLERVVGEETGIGGSGALDAVAATSSTAWPVVAAAAGVAAAALGVAVAIASRSWPASGRRYERGASTADPRDAVEAWDAISQGEDPTAGGR